MNGVIHSPLWNHSQKLTAVLLGEDPVAKRSRLRTMITVCLLLTTNNRRESPMSWTVAFPPKLDLNHPELLRLLARAQALASVIHQIPLSPRTTEKLNRLNILRAVRGTTC